MTPAQIRKAEQLLAKKRELLTLTDRNSESRGTIGLAYVYNYQRKDLVLELKTGMTVTVDTLEKWIKQAKKAHKMGIL